MEREKRSFKTLKTFFGDMLLSDIDRSKVMEYRSKRSAEPKMRRGKPVADTKIKFSYGESRISFSSLLAELGVG